MFGVLNNIGGSEVIIIAVLILFFFGSGKLSEFAKGIRQSKEEIKKIKDELEKPEDTKDNVG